jgi:hypothetical protein
VYCLKNRLDLLVVDELMNNGCAGRRKILSTLIAFCLRHTTIFVPVQQPGSSPGDVLAAEISRLVTVDCLLDINAQRRI